VSTHTVRLVRLPVEIHRRAATHSDAINRELSLITAGDDDSVPARLRSLSERLTARYGGMTANQNEQLERAQADQVEAIDLVYELPGEVAEAAEELGAMLDEVDEYCRDGALLNLVTPPEAVAYRKWFLTEFIHQIREGAEPRPWPEFAAGERPDVEDVETSAAEAASGPETPDAAVIAVKGSLDLDGASRLRPVVAEHLDAGQATLAFDLSDCDFVDSVGLSLLLTTRARCLEMGGSVRVQHPQPFVRTTFLHAGLLSVLQVEEP
jgi:anti-sigma B factor antagonist